MDSEDDGGDGDIGRGSGDGGGVKSKGLRCVDRDVCFIAGAAGRPGGKCGNTVLQADDIEARLRHFRAGSSETWQIGGDGRETETC